MKLDLGKDQSIEAKKEVGAGGTSRLVNIRINNNNSVQTAMLNRVELTAFIAGLQQIQKEMD